MKYVWKNCYTNISLWSPTQVPKSPYCLQGLEFAVTLAHFFLFASHRVVCLKKSKKDWSFLLKSFLKIERWNVKSKFSSKLWVFLVPDMTRCVLPFFGQSIITHLLASFHAQGDGYQGFGWDSDFEIRSLTSFFFQNVRSLGKLPLFFYHISISIFPLSAFKSQNSINPKIVGYFLYWVNTKAGHLKIIYLSI